MTRVTRPDTPNRHPGVSRTSVPRLDAFRFWLKLGFISFGGPAGQIAVMHRELVDERRWISNGRFLHALNYCMLLPGPEAQQLATYIGWLFHRTWGGIVAGSLFVLPSLVILMGLSWIYLAFGDVPIVAGLFSGIKPAVAAIVVHAVHRLASRALQSAVLWIVAGAAFLAIFVWDVPFPAIIAAAALVGMVGARSGAVAFRATPGRHMAETAPASGPAIIDDDTAAPAHARFTFWGAARVGATGAVLWAVPMAALATTFGWTHTLTQMAWFFTKAALVTFGGAYAVLPYVYQAAVGHYGWLTAPQMIDGLALGETTPGPLIMVVAFVGFVGGYTEAFFGPAWPVAAGAAAALVVTWFTFLPSFLFILGGAPVVEQTHGTPTFTAPLMAITAAVVGVVLNLAVFFTYHVVWPGGIDQPADSASAVIGLSAAVALMRLRIGIIATLGASALAGLAWSVVAPLLS
ncbi:MAG: chromate efflux transporter [Acidobacteriota bacterium]